MKKIDVGQRGGASDVVSSDTAAPRDGHLRNNARKSGDKIVRNSLYLIASSATMGLSGFAFWAIVARLFNPTDVGLASSLISAVVLISYLSLAGLDVTIIRFGSEFGDRDGAVFKSMLVIALTAGLISAVYTKCITIYAPELRPVIGSDLVAAGFIAVCILAAINLYTDSVFIAHMRPEFNLATDGMIQGVFKIVAPFLFVSSGAFGIVAATGVGYLVTVAASIALIYWSLGLRPRSILGSAKLSRFWKFSAAAYFANVLNIAPMMLLPVITVHAQGAATAAYYFIAFQISNLVNAASYAVAQSMFSEGSQNQDRDPSALVRKAAKVLFGLLTPGVVGAMCLSPWILVIIGSNYRDNAGALLRLMLLGCFAVAANTMAVYVLKLRGRMQRWIYANLASCVVTLGMAQLLGSRGVDWIAWAWIVGNLTGTLIALLPKVRWRRGPIHA